MNLFKQLAILLVLYSSAALAHDSEFRGTYVWGAEVDIFSPCNSQLVYWTSYNWAGVPLREFYEANTSEPYQKIYIKFRGQILNEDVDGFASNYDGLIHISEIYEIKIDLPNDCKANL